MALVYDGEVGVCQDRSVFGRGDGVGHKDGVDVQRCECEQQSYCELHGVNYINQPYLQIRSLCLLNIFTVITHNEIYTTIRNVKYPSTIPNTNTATARAIAASVDVLLVTRTIPAINSADNPAILTNRQSNTIQDTDKNYNFPCPMIHCEHPSHKVTCSNEAISHLQ